VSVGTWTRVGDTLVRQGLVAPADLQRALEVQKRTGQRLGHVLVDLGLASEEAVARAVALQHGLSHRPGELTIDPDLLARLGLDVTWVKLRRALPLAEEDGVLVLAMEDPLDPTPVDDLTLGTGRPVRAVVVTRGQLDYALLSLEGSATVRSDSGDASAPATVEVLLERAVRAGASDIHLEPGSEGMRIRFRQDGLLRDAGVVPESEVSAVLTRLKVMAQLDIAEHRAPQDGRTEAAVAGRRLDVRVSVLPTIHGEKVVLRLLDPSQLVRDAAALGMGAGVARALAEVLGRPSGMLFVSGPTGSGKTTTLMASLAMLNDRSRNLVTLEDPVEYRLPGANQVSVNPRAGLGFADGLRAVLRQDPDVILVGEVRDGETAAMAVRAALTGHFVLSSIHTRSAAATPARLVDMGVEPYLVASALVGIVAQRLVRRICTSCRSLRPVTPEEAERLLVARDAKVATAVGCAACGHTGYRGRIGLFECLKLSEPLADLVARRRPTAEILAQARREGFRPLVEDGWEKVRAGLTTPEEVSRVAYA
jgi:type IV pilus assembly protein PilB